MYLSFSATADAGAVKVIEHIGDCQDEQKSPRNFAERAMSNGSHSRNVIQHRTDQVPLFRSNLPCRRGYISESNLSEASIYESQILASLGVTPGLHVWRWAVIQRRIA